MRMMLQIQRERAKTVKVTKILIKFHFENKQPKKYCSKDTRVTPQNTDFRLYQLFSKEPIISAMRGLALIEEI